MKTVAVVLSLIILACLYLLFTDSRVLYKETKVDPGQTYFVEEHGDLGKSQQASLVCNYFTGRNTVQKVFWYSANNFMGKDSCPFLVKG